MKKLSARHRTRRNEPISRQNRFSLEELEVRNLMTTTFVVDSLLDEIDGDSSTGMFRLREAVEQANLTDGDDNIVFDPSLTANIDNGADLLA